MGKKKYRIKWGCVTMFALAVVLLGVGLYYAVVGAVGLIKSWLPWNSAETAQVEVMELDPQQLAESTKMTARLDSLMREPMRLDTSKIAVSVYDVTTQQQIYSLHDRQLLPPASCLKIATAITAMKKLGMNHEYHESLLIRGQLKRDTLVGTLLLKADDDPLLETFDDLVKQMHKRGIRHIRGNVVVDLAREDTLRPHPTAKTWDIPYNRTPLLLKGKQYVVRTLLYTLTTNGISLHRDESVKPEGKYRYVASSSHKLRDVVTPMMIHSSNIKAEAVLYHLDYKGGKIADRRAHWDIAHETEMFLRRTFRDDSTHVMNGFVINDGSGLSPQNRMTASFLVDMLKYAYDDKALRDYFINEALATPDDGLRRGSLLSRMQQPEYRGRIFCKTGTVVTIGASSLAGYLRGCDGHWYIFSIINTDSPVAESRIFQDRLCKLMMSGKRTR